MATFLKSALSTILILGILILPVSVSADACDDALTMANEKVSGTWWFLGGCCLGYIGVYAAHITSVEPPSSAIMGKSPDYILDYTQCYRKEARGIATRNAWYGCGTAVLAGGVAIGLVFLTTNNQ